MKTSDCRVVNRRRTSRNSLVFQSPTVHDSRLRRRVPHVTRPITGRISPVALIARVATRARDCRDLLKSCATRARDNRENVYAINRSAVDREIGRVRPPGPSTRQPLIIVIVVVERVSAGVLKRR